MPAVGHVIATINPPKQQVNPNPAGTGAHHPGDSARITLTILNTGESVTALADLNTGRPALTGGGAKWNTIDRPLRTGLSVFAGYDPLQIVVPLLIDNFVDGATIEDDVALLWKMWGRGVGAANTNAASKQAPVIVLDGTLLPSPVRFSASENPSPPNWVITDISEDSASAVFNSANHLVRLPVTVTLGEYNPSSALASLTSTTTTSTPVRTKTAVFPAGSTMRGIATAQRTTVVHLRDLNGYGSNKLLDRYLRDPSLPFRAPLKVKVPRVKAS